MSPHADSDIAATRAPAAAVIDRLLGRIIAVLPSAL
jgi:hypothetical protein